MRALRASTRVGARCGCGNRLAFFVLGDQVCGKCGRRFRAGRPEYSGLVSATFGMLPFTVFPLLLMAGLPLWFTLGLAPAAYLAAAIFATFALQRWNGVE